MKNLNIAGAVALLTTLNAQAQTQPSTLDKAWVNLNVTQLNMQLDLSDEQEAKVKELDTRYIKRHEALEQTMPKLSEKDMSDKTAALMVERDREMQKVLTPEQYTKWDGMRQKGTGDLTPEKKEQMK